MTDKQAPAQSTCVGTLAVNECLLPIQRIVLRDSRLVLIAKPVRFTKQLGDAISGRQMYVLFSPDGQEVFSTFTHLVLPRLRDGAWVFFEIPFQLHEQVAGE